MVEHRLHEGSVRRQCRTCMVRTAHDCRAVTARQLAQLLVQGERRVRAPDLRARGVVVGTWPRAPLPQQSATPTCTQLPTAGCATTVCQLCNLRLCPASSSS
jgi:hypothetical protein